MSITVRLWSEQDLKDIESDNWLATIFMNVTTFSKKEIAKYPYDRCKSYLAEFDMLDEDGTNTGLDEVKFYATDDIMAQRFLKEEYCLAPLALYRIETEYIPIID